MNNKKIFIPLIVILFILLASVSYWAGKNSNIQANKELKKINNILNSGSIDWNSYLVGNIKNISGREITVKGFSSNKELTVDILPSAKIYEIYYFKAGQTLPEGFSEEDLIGEPFTINGADYVSAEKDISFEEIKAGDDIFVQFEITPNYKLKGSVVKVREPGSQPADL